MVRPYIVPLGLIERLAEDRATFNLSTSPTRS